MPVWVNSFYKCAKGCALWLRGIIGADETGKKVVAVVSANRWQAPRTLFVQAKILEVAYKAFDHCAVAKDTAGNKSVTPVTENVVKWVCEWLTGLRNNRSLRPPTVEATVLHT